MKKSLKLTLAIGITIALYAGFYFWLVQGSSPEVYAQRLWGLIVSLVGCVIAIPVGIGVTWYLQKKNVDKSKSNIAIVVIAILFGFLFGWLSIAGMVIGGYIVEKDA